MVSHSLSGAYSDCNSQILWEDGERVFRRGSQLGDGGQQREVLIVVPTADHPVRANTLLQATKEEVMSKYTGDDDFEIVQTWDNGKFEEIDLDKWVQASPRYLLSNNFAGVPETTLAKLKQA